VGTPPAHRPGGAVAAETAAVLPAEFASYGSANQYQGCNQDEIHLVPTVGALRAGGRAFYLRRTLHRPGLFCGRARFEGALGALESRRWRSADDLVGDAGEDEAGFEQKEPFDVEGALVVEELAPAGDAYFGHDDHGE
jgi:hypothetical protein